MIKFRCPNCTQKISVNYEGADAVIGCPTCTQTIIVPLQTSAEFRPLKPPFGSGVASNYLQRRIPTPMTAGGAPRLQTEDVPPLTPDPAPSDQAHKEHEPENDRRTHEALLPYLARMMMSKLVRSLLTQHRHLMTTQTIGIEQITALESRLETLQQNYGVRLKTYEIQVAALEHHLEQLLEINRTLEREKFLLTHQLAAHEDGEESIEETVIPADCLNAL